MSVRIVESSIVLTLLKSALSIKITKKSQKNEKETLGMFDVILVISQYLISSIQFSISIKLFNSSLFSGRQVAFDDDCFSKSFENALP